MRRQRRATNFSKLSNSSNGGYVSVMSEFLGCTFSMIHYIHEHAFGPVYPYHFCQRTKTEQTKAKEEKRQALNT